jgi:hypothetical protein
MKNKFQLAGIFIYDMIYFFAVYPRGFRFQISVNNGLRSG